MPAAKPKHKPLAGKVQMRFCRVDMRDLGHVQAQTLKDHFGVGRQASATQLRTRIASLLQDQDAGCEIGGELDKMKGSGQTGWAAAEDQDIRRHGVILTTLT